MKMYKNGKSVEVDRDQVEIMKDAGYGFEESVPEKKEKAKTAAELAADEKKAADEKAKSTAADKTGS